VRPLRSTAPALAFRRGWHQPPRPAALPLIAASLATSAALFLGCERIDLTRPEPLPRPLAQVTPVSVGSVGASGYQDPNVPQNTLDNNLATRWSAPGDGQWIQYDLGVLKAVGRVDIAWYQATGQQWESVFDIAVSSDADTWTTVFSGRSISGNVRPEGYGFSTVTCRYVRIIGHGQIGSPSSTWNSITEVDIYSPHAVTAVGASGYEAPNVPGNTLDNNLGTRWSAPGDGQWIRYDLGTAKAIGGVDIAWYQAAGQQWESVFDIEVSPDNATWTRVFSGRSLAGYVQHQRYEFSTVSCRYVRIVGHGQIGSPSSSWNSITEVDILPGSGASTCPAPATGPQPGTIIFQDGFEGADFSAWNSSSLSSRITLETTPARVRSGAKSLKMSFPTVGTAPSGWVGRIFANADEIYFRYYIMFESGFTQSLHGSALTGNRTDNLNSADGTAGTRPNGTDFFYAGVDPVQPSNTNNLGPFSFYTYFPDMTGSFGQRFFQTSPAVAQTEDVWHEVVHRIKLNTVSPSVLSDGLQELWVDGQKKISVPNMRWRTSSILRLNKVRFHMWTSSIQAVKSLWIDQVTVWTP
jgi:F5/8 type C domain-containing protein